MILKYGLHERAPIPDADWFSRWPNFTPLELACKCGGEFCNRSYFHDPAFLDALQELRNDQGRLVINSGHRCPSYNAKIGGAPKSQHLGIAVDISLDGHDRWALAAAARQFGFTGFGYGLTFLHLALRDRSAQWDYGPASRIAWKLDE